MSERRVQFTHSVLFSRNNQETNVLLIDISNASYCLFTVGQPSPNSFCRGVYGNGLITLTNGQQVLTCYSSRHRLDSDHYCYSAAICWMGPVDRERICCLASHRATMAPAAACFRGQQAMLNRCCETPANVLQGCLAA